jgi:hypothetical protein
MGDTNARNFKDTFYILRKFHMVDFKEMKNSSARSLQSLSEEVAKMAEGRKSDDRFWTPTLDKAENGFAIIRFLPAPQGEDVPFIRMFDHGFQGPGGWYIENSLTTIGLDDPVSEYNSQLWNSTTDDKSPARDQARKQKRRLHFVSNIYVVQDTANPESEGKVFLFKYGKKIFNKLTEAMEPQFADEKAINPFDFWTGANFKLKIRKFEGYRNYDRSEFDAQSVLNDSDAELERIWKSEYPLQPFLDSSNFKTYDVLKQKLDKVLNGTVTRKDDTAPWNEEAEQPRQKTASATKSARPLFDDADDDSLELFRQFASE